MCIRDSLHLRQNKKGGIYPRCDKERRGNICLLYTSISVQKNRKVTKLKFSIALIVNVVSSLLSIVSVGVFLSFSSAAITSSSWVDIAFTAFAFELHQVPQCPFSVIFTKSLRTLHVWVEQEKKVKRRSTVPKKCHCLNIYTSCMNSNQVKWMVVTGNKHS